MRSFLTYLAEEFNCILEAYDAKVSKVKALPKPDDKTVWDRLRHGKLITGWLFKNGAVAFNPYTGHEDNIRKYFKLDSGGDRAGSVTANVEAQGIAVHIEDEGGDSIEFRCSKEMRPFAQKWVREMGIREFRPAVRFETWY